MPASPPRLQLSYYDRRSGRVVSDPVNASRLHDWSHNTRAGRKVTRWLLCRRFVSSLIGGFASSRVSRRLIPGMVERLQVDMTESVARMEEFESFQEFFQRDIDLRKRPIDAAPLVCASPADGRILAFPSVHADQTLLVKRTELSPRELLRDDQLAGALSGGAVVIIRLYVGDYHHFHFPDSGVPGAARDIPGRYYAVTPYTLGRHLPFYRDNHRAVTPFASDHFGLIAMVEVGGFAVGTIRQRFEPNRNVSKGARKGAFGVGGSTIVLLFSPGAIVLDGDLLEHSAEQREVYVRLGESIGRSARDA